MKTNAKTRRKLLASLMTIVLTLGMLPVSAFAENEPAAAGAGVAAENAKGGEEPAAGEAGSPDDPGEQPGPGEDEKQGEGGGDKGQGAGGEEPAAKDTGAPGDPGEQPESGGDKGQGAGGEEKTTTGNPAPSPSGNEQEKPPATQQEDAPSTAPHAHEFGAEWKYDGANHWHECTAGDGGRADEAAHAFGDWTTKKQATETEPGSKERACSVCGYAETEAIPVLEEVGSADGNVPAEQAAPAADAQVEAKSPRAPILTAGNEYAISTTVKDNVGGSVYVRATSDATPLTSAEADKPLIVIATPESGYTLSGLYLLKTGDPAPAAPYSIQLDPAGSAYSFAMPSYDVTVYAVFEDASTLPKHKRFTLYFNSGTNGNGPQKSIVLEETSPGDAIEYTLPDYSKMGFTPHTGYDFAGWLYGEDDTLYKPGDTISVTSDKTIFGQCAEPRTFTVYFDAREETSDRPIPADKITTAMPPVTIREEHFGAGVSYTLPQPGFIFTEGDLTFRYYRLHEKLYQPGDSISSDEHAITDNGIWQICLYAWYTYEKTYRVTVTDDGNGTAKVDAPLCPGNGQVTLAATPNSGYRFKEWEVVSGTVRFDDFYGGKTGVKSQVQIAEEDVVIKANFEVDPDIVHNVTVNKGDFGSGTVEASPVSGKAGTVVTLTATPTGSDTFREWKVVSGEATIADPTSPTTTFTIGATDVEIEGVFGLEPIYAYIPYTVTYQVENGTWSDGTTENKKETVINGKFPVDVPTGMIAKPGYENGAWNTEPSSSRITNDATFVYTFALSARPEAHTIIANADPAEGGTVTGGGSVTPGESTTITATATEGYVFVGWWDGDTKVSDDASYTFTVTGDITLTAKYKKITQLLNHNKVAVPDQEVGVGRTSATTFGVWADGGSVQLDNQRIKDRINILLDRTAVSENIRFDGTSGSTIQYTGNGRFILLCSGAQLGPVGSEHAVEVRYEGDDTYAPCSAIYKLKVVAIRGLYVAEFSPTIAEVNKPFTISGRILDENDQPAVDQYVQVLPQIGPGYYVFSDQDGRFSVEVNKYIPSEHGQVMPVDVFVESNLYEELWEHFSVKFSNRHAVTVTAEPAEGGTVTGGGAYLEGESATVKATAGEGYAFAGWWDGDKLVSGDLEYTFTVTDDIALTAKFVKMWTVTMDMNGGTIGGAASSTMDFEDGHVDRLPTAEDMKEWIAEGTWITGPADSEYIGAEITDANGTKTYQPGDAYTVISDAAIKVLWKSTVVPPAPPAPPATYTVTFDANGHGTAPAAQSVEDGKTAARPADPAEAGWAFGGWYTEAGCANEFDFATPISGDITLYAKWSEDEAAPPAPATSTISYDLNGGTLDGKTGVVTVVAENGTTITLPAPTREGYAFDYWEGSRYDAGDSYTVNGDHTFTAQWKKDGPAAPDKDAPDEDAPDKGDPEKSAPGADNSGRNAPGAGASVKGASVKGAPKTGDEVDPMPWSVAMVASLAAMALALSAIRKRA